MYEDMIIASKNTEGKSMKKIKINLMFFLGDLLAKENSGPRPPHLLVLHHRQRLFNFTSMYTSFVIII